MDDSPGSDRPLKRVKYAQQDDEPIVTFPVSMATGANNSRPAYAVPVSSVFPTPWSSQSELASPSEVLMALAEDPHTSWAPSVPVTQSAPLEIKDTFAQQQTLSRPLSPLTSRSFGLAPVVVDEPQSETHPQITQIIKPPRQTFISPFTDKEDRLIKTPVPRYARPENGQVNGYVKFHWPSRRQSTRPSISDPSSSNEHSSGNDVEEVISESTLPTTSSLSPGVVTIVGAVSPSNGNVIASPVFSEIAWDLIPSTASGLIMPLSPQDSSTQLLLPGEPPRMIPPHFGYQAKMDVMDRRLWDFYVRNWCPGRSVLAKTNLWLRDFAQMQESEGIRAAIQSLAGVYIYDYLPDERIRHRINERYVTAGEHFSKLLDSSESFEVGKGDEVITMAVILSMQDIILTERRLKKPYAPRWLEGFKQGEHFLHQTDPGGRFWRDNNIQVDSLRLSQSIIVGRAVILAQPMMELPHPESLKPEQEAARFGWLLYGTEMDMYEIHGGCGFSKKLLYTISQVTYCAARIQQDPASTIMPVTARYLQHELLEMRQWSSEVTAIGGGQKRPLPIAVVKEKPDNYVIHSPEEMTDVTAEAWRIATLIYLQCRVFRLPRNHHDVMVNMADLAKCISVMPTSGSAFTAQAPLLPVFFLGLLATDPKHRKVSQTWFEQVVRTPVRSSVPPLYQALRRIWAWIDTEVPVPSAPAALNKSLGLRSPWWESLVAKVQDKEEETLCLT